jgi:hypothetical protein
MDISSTKRSWRQLEGGKHADANSDDIQHNEHRRNVSQIIQKIKWHNAE